MKATVFVLVLTIFATTGFAQQKQADNPPPSDSGKGESCTVPVGSFSGWLDATDRDAGTTTVLLTVKSQQPPVVQFKFEGSRQRCAGDFPSVADKATCVGNEMRVWLDRSATRTDDCKASPPLHIRFEDGKIKGRFGGPAISQQKDNLKF